ncbi:peroxide stress protein YaaA [Pokkaliibacter sp. CJK22405]|uniref:peroxide stress protein YaaA n=1 Tax=Pokkaliibacter sp. CJK22405 TaxID=3384615 RepID=UPI0039852B02
MLAVISPAKTLDYETPAITKTSTKPDFIEDSAALIDELKALTPADISQLMSLSDKLSSLNAARFAQWSKTFTEENSKQAVLAFKGDVYQGLDAESLDDDGLTYAQQHLRILSGLYGLLRPLDQMQPYRLEMGTKFANARGKDLYAFWGDKITQALNKALENSGDSTLINLASNEYFKAVKKAKLKGRLITPVFKDYKNGEYKIISFYAKKARGLMVRYMIDHQPREAEELKNFDYDGYAFNAAASEEDTWVFLRDAT